MKQNVIFVVTLVRGKQGQKIIKINSFSQYSEIKTVFFRNGIEKENVVVTKKEKIISFYAQRYFR